MCVCVCVRQALSYSSSPSPTPLSLAHPPLPYVSRLCRGLLCVCVCVCVCVRETPPPPPHVVSRLWLSCVCVCACLLFFSLDLFHFVRKDVEDGVFVCARAGKCVCDNVGNFVIGIHRRTLVCIVRDEHFVCVHVCVNNGLLIVIFGRITHIRPLPHAPYELHC